MRDMEKKKLSQTQVKVLINLLNGNVGRIKRNGQKVLEVEGKKVCPLKSIELLSEMGLVDEFGSLGGWVLTDYGMLEIWNIRNLAKIESFEVISNVKMELNIEGRNFTIEMFDGKIRCKENGKSSELFILGRDAKIPLPVKYGKFLLDDRIGMQKFKNYIVEMVIKKEFPIVNY